MRIFESIGNRNDWSALIWYLAGYVCRSTEKEHIVMEYAGFGGLIILALDLWAIVSILGSNRDTMAKVLWTLLVLVLPVAGFIIWLIAGPRSRSRTI